MTIQAPNPNGNGQIINVPTATYSEGLTMGYRWYESQNITPLFPFGYGLSYTTFSMSALGVTPKVSDGTQPLTLTLSVQNTGPVAGAEVAQAYIGLPAGLGEPPKRLVAFQKVFLQPGETKQVQMTINPAASNHPLSWWDSPSQSWKTAAGFYPIYVGNSSANVALAGTFLVRPPQ